VEERQHVAFAADDPVQPLHDSIQQRRAEIFEHVPDQHAIEMAVFVVQSLLEEVLDLAGIRLIRGVVHAERVVENLQKVFTVAAVDTGAGAACAGLGAGLGSGFTISMLPLKYAPSSMMIRAVRISPVSLASLRISSLSVASTLPWIAPSTTTSRALMVAFTV